MHKNFWATLRGRSKKIICLILRPTNNSVLTSVNKHGAKRQVSAVDTIGGESAEQLEELGCETESLTNASGTVRQKGFRQLLRDMLIPSSSQLVIGMVLFLTGLLIVIGIKTQSSGFSYESMRREDLIQVLDGLNEESKRLGNEIRSLEKTKQELVSGANSALVAREQKQKLLDNLEILSGTVATHGPGIRITIKDPENHVGPEILLNAIEEMRDAGGEAIQINKKVRIVASSWFGRGKNGRLVVDDIPIDKPIVLEVIGNPDTLDAGARFRGGIVSQIEASNIGGKVIISRIDNIEINSIHKTKVFKVARPAGN